MGVRRLTRRKHGLNGLFPSLKTERMIWFESFLERDFIRLLEFDPDVLTFAEQPFTLKYQHLGKTRRYTLDFHVRYTPGRDVLVECKPTAFVATEENQIKFRAAQAWCAEHSWTFCVMTEADVRQEPRLTNIKLLARYSRLSVSPQFQSQVFAVLANTPRLSLGQIAQRLEPANPTAAVPGVLHLASRHAIAVALDDAPLSLETWVTLPSSASGEGV